MWLLQVQLKEIFQNTNKVKNYSLKNFLLYGKINVNLNIFQVSTLIKDEENHKICGKQVIRYFCSIKDNNKRWYLNYR